MNRIGSFNKVYLIGSPDLLSNSFHKYYSGLAIEFKNPKETGILTSDQQDVCTATTFRQLLAMIMILILKK